MLFKRKLKGTFTPVLDDQCFGKVINLNPKEVSHKYAVMADHQTYTLLYRDGAYMGIPYRDGGAIYPFSVNPKKRGTKRMKKKFRAAKVVIFRKDFVFRMEWGTPRQFYVKDPVTKAPYHIGASGIIALQIDANDAAISANKFYSTCLPLNAENFTVDDLFEQAHAAFNVEIARLLEEYLIERNEPLSTFGDVTPTERIEMSTELCKRLKTLFLKFGLVIMEEYTSRSLLAAVLVKSAN